MFEPTEDEARRERSLDLAIMSTSSSEMHFADRYTTQSSLIVERAKEFEKYLKEGGEVPEVPEPTPPPARGSFGAYQERGLDAGS